jgi:acetyl-CoA acetyltransferase
MSECKARELGLARPVRVAASVLHSGWDHEPRGSGLGDALRAEAYEEAGLGPEDLGVIEVHDASAIAQLLAYESLGLCPRWQGATYYGIGVRWRGSST